MNKWKNEWLINSCLYDGILNTDKKFCSFTGMFVNIQRIWGSISNLLDFLLSAGSLLLHYMTNLTMSNIKEWKKIPWYLGCQFQKKKVNPAEL